MVTSPTVPLSLSRMASSRAISQKGLTENLTPVLATPERSPSTDTFTEESITRFIGTNTRSIY